MDPDLLGIVETFTAEFANVFPDGIVDLGPAGGHVLSFSSMFVQKRHFFHVLAANLAEISGGDAKTSGMFFPVQNSFGVGFVNGIADFTGVWFFNDVEILVEPKILELVEITVAKFAVIDFRGC